MLGRTSFARCSHTTTPSLASSLATLPVCSWALPSVPVPVACFPVLPSHCHRQLLFYCDRPALAGRSPSHHSAVLGFLLLRQPFSQLTPFPPPSPILLLRHTQLAHPPRPRSFPFCKPSHTGGRPRSSRRIQVVLGTDSPPPPQILHLVHLACRPGL